MKRKILLITTKGCEGCAIMDNIIQRALDLYSKPVDYEIKDKENIDIGFLTKHHITDFPTTILYDNDNIVFITTGTKPVERFLSNLNTHFD